MATKSKRKPVKTREERNAEWAALALLVESFDAEAFEESEPERYDALCKKYSERNVALILSQFPDAVEVAGFHAWLERGRCVRKGEHSIAILAPAGASGGEEVKDESGSLTGETSPVRRHFKLARVFDVSQTEPLPPKPEEDK